MCDVSGLTVVHRMLCGGCVFVGCRSWVLSVQKMARGEHGVTVAVTGSWVIGT